MAVSRMRSQKYAIKPLFMAESPKFARPRGNGGVEEHDDDVRFYMEIWPFRACAVKIRNISLVIGTIWSLYSCYEADIRYTECF